MSHYNKICRVTDLSVNGLIWQIQYVGQKCQVDLAIIHVYIHAVQDTHA